MVIIYGVGKVFEDNKRCILSLNKKIDGVYDRKLVSSRVQKWGGINVCSIDEIMNINEASRVYICLSNLENAYQVKRMLQKNKNLTLFAPAECRNSKVLSQQELICRSSDGVYKDIYNNFVYFKKPVSRNIRISFEGSNSKVIIENDIRVDQLLHIAPGTNAIIRIGAKTSFVSTSLYISFGTLDIGPDCLFSSGIVIRNHDGHHIFNMNTHKRVNYSKNISIGKHCWIGHNVTILKNVSLDSGSVVGEQSVVTKSFGKNIVVAGNPAQIVKEGIYWRRDLTNVFDYNEDAEG